MLLIKSINFILDNFMNKFKKMFPEIEYIYKPIFYLCVCIFGSGFSDKRESGVNPELSP